jgi:hypothetical protein
MCIDEEEIVDVVNYMHNNTAGGPDGLIIEMFKCSSDITAPLLKALFHKMLDTGCFAENWCEAVICPVHKKGDKLSPDNYRGISLLNIMGKIFTKLVNNRLVAWAHENDKLYEQHSGLEEGMHV